MKREELIQVLENVLLGYNIHSDTSPFCNGTKVLKERIESLKAGESDYFLSPVDKGEDMAAEEYYLTYYGIEKLPRHRVICDASEIIEIMNKYSALRKVEKPLKIDLFEEKDKCIAGCKVFTGNERYHHKDCPYYPGSMSELFDEMKAQLQKVEMPNDIKDINFIKWYSGMDESKIRKAFERFKKENQTPQ